MNVRECYELMDGDFEGVMSRLLAESRVAKFVVRFIDDPSYNSLTESWANGDIEVAFRAAHTLKGTSANLGFTALYTRASDVTEELRQGNPSSEIGRKLELLAIEYDKVCNVLRRYSAEKED